MKPLLSLPARPYYKRVAICCTVFFLVMGVFSVFVAATNADGSFESPLLAASIFGVFWGAFILLGIYLWLFSRRYRLEITEDAIEQIGVFTKRRVSFHELQNAKWRNWPQGGSIKLTTADARLSIELGTTDSRDSLIDFLHGRIPTSIQTGWSRFLYDKEQINAQKSLSPFWLGIMFYMFAVSFVAAWLTGMGGVNLLAAVVNFGFATYTVTRKPKENSAANVRSTPP